MPVPDLSRVPSFYHNYINLVQSNDLVGAMKEQHRSFYAFLASIPKDKEDHAYAEGKWSVKEVLQHVIDAERIFAYRALCFARKDQTPLPSFDEENYGKNAKARSRSWNGLCEEFDVVRRATEILFESFDEEQLESSGIASGNSNYVRAFGFIIVGHLRHHEIVLSERYLKVNSE